MTKLPGRSNLNVPEAPHAAPHQDRHAMHLVMMRAALVLADEAAARGEVPIGAVVEFEGRIVGRGHNQPISSHDPTAHAEVVAIRAAGIALGTYRLTGARLYVTVEPCLMCVGAAIHARIDTVVYGAIEPRAGAIESRQRAYEHASLNHKIKFVAGVLAPEARARMIQFFQDKR
jgi:tRNA(adenine34) deaminase